MMSSSLPHILVIRSGGLGDFVLTLPVLSAVKERWPKASLHVLGHTEIAETARLAGVVDQIRSIDSFDLSPLFSGLPGGGNRRERAESYLRGFDIVISFLRDTEDHFSANLRRLGVQEYLVPPARSEALHATQQFFRSLSGLGLKPEFEYPRLSPPASACEEVRQMLAVAAVQNHTTLVAIHPGSGSKTKNWPLEHYFEVIQWVAEQPGLYPILLTGEADGEIHERMEVDPRIVNCPHFPSPALPVLVALLQRCGVFLGNDSGVGHLAAASGIPVISLFGATSPQVWKPLGQKVRVINFSEASVDRVCRELAQILGRGEG
ncbi:MAG: glycosyltransferase family 9 protein [Acidobacteriota bacterium]|nr:MAG: glycosyltransferase family 9 protein [Acidobacteriota bacterium]